jgi:hypothetical protein
MAIIDKPTDYFNTVLWTGNGSTQSITSLDFQPDFVWYKSRSNTYNHGLFDSIRGASKFLKSNSTDAESTISGVTAFDSDGFSVGSDAGGNASGQTYVGWNWKGGGTASTNTDGNVNTTVSANPTAGFSIISANTGSTTGELTLGHGLNAVPSMFIWKNRDVAGQNWQVYHKSTGTGLMRLNDSGAVNNDVVFWNTPTTSLFKMSTHMYQQNINFIGYCFADVKGFSKMGSYTGNGSTDGTFVYTGFSPAFVMIKKSSASGSGWVMSDNKRNPTNDGATIRLMANSTEVDATGDHVFDMLSNGFKIRDSDATINASGATYIYMAFAENPFVGSDGTPVTAR